MSSGIDEVISQIRPREASCVVSLREDLVARIREMNDRVRDALAYDADHNKPATAPAVRAELDQLVADYEAAQATFRFRSLPHDQWMDLLAQHPPGPEDTAAGRDYHAVSFPIAAIAASCFEPDGVTEAKVRELATVLAHGPFQALFETAMTVNLAVEDETIPFSAAAIGAILDSVPSSTTAASEGSPTAPSPGG